MELREEVRAADAETRSPRERLDTALAGIGARLEGDETEVPAARDTRRTADRRVLGQYCSPWNGRHSWFERASQRAAVHV
jgi:hypothetical protein